MQFLAPAFLAGVIAVAIPVWLHLARQNRVPVVPFSAVRFIPAAPVEQRATRRLRDLVLLAVRVAAIVLLALAFARPFLAASAEPSPVTVVLVDVSASMGGPRFADARRLARAVIDAAPAGHRVAVASFDRRGNSVLAPQSSRGAAHAAIDRLVPGFGPTRYAAGIATAAGLVGGAPGHIVIVTDRQLAGWAGEGAAPVPPGVDVEWVAVDAPERNIAVTDVTVRAGRPRATIVNTGRVAVESVVTLAATARDEAARAELATRSVRIVPGETQVVEFDAAVPSSGSIEVAADDPDGVPADDVRHLSLDPLPQARVLVVTSGLDEHAEAFYLQHALEAGGGTGHPLVRVVGGTTLRDGFADALEDVDVAVLLSTRGIERSGPDAIRGFRARGGGTLLVAGPTAEPGVLADMLDAGAARVLPASAGTQAMVVSDSRHPVMASLGALAGALGTVRVSRTILIDAADTTNLARFTSGAPAFVERRSVNPKEGRTLLLATDVGNAWNDLALHPAFVPLVHEVVAHLARPSGTKREYLVGEPGAPSDVPGVVRLAADRAVRAVVNVDPAESDSAVFLDADARVVENAAAGMRATDARREREADNPLWRYALVGVLLALLIEGAVAGRRAYAVAR